MNVSTTPIPAERVTRLLSRQRMSFVSAPYEQLHYDQVPSEVVAIYDGTDVVKAAVRNSDWHARLARLRLMAASMVFAQVRDSVYGEDSRPINIDQRMFLTFSSKAGGHDQDP